MGSHHHISIEQEQFVVPQKAKTFAIVLMVIGLICTGIGLVTLPKSGATSHNEAKVEHATTHEQAAPAHSNGAEAHASVGAAAHEEGNMKSEKFGLRAEYHPHEKSAMTYVWANLLIVGYFFLIISLAALFFVAVQYIANAGWSAAIKRVPEAIYTFFPVAFIVVLVVLVIAKNDLYHWAHYEHQSHAEHLKPGMPGYDSILEGKKGFLNSTMLIAFPAVLVAIWFLIGRKLRSLSVQEDVAEKGSTFFFKKSIRWSAGMAVVYGFSFSVLAWLIMMSIDAHWYSTIFGVYNFATGWVTSLTVICLFVVYLRSKGFLKIVTDEHVHDLGKFMFAFSIFWTYIWTSQYLLIWYAHIPEEMAYYQIRFENYKFNFLVNVFLNFLCPFLLLMMRNAKRNPTVLAITGFILILGHYNDVWLMVIPGVFGPGKQIGFLEIGFLTLFAGIFVYWVLIALTKRGLIAVNHPYIEESAHHDVGV